MGPLEQYYKEEFSKPWFPEFDSLSYSQRYYLSKSLGFKMWKFRQSCKMFSDVCSGLFTGLCNGLFGKKKRR